MKLRIRVDQTTYDVEVEVVDPFAAASAASRVEGAPVGKAMPPLIPAKGRNGNGQRPVAASVELSPGVKATAQASPATPAPPPAPVAWHGQAVGADGEVLAPVPGTVRGVHVKVGDAVRAHDPLVSLEVSRVVAPQDKPLVGTIRALQGGVVRDVAVAAGADVAFGQVLVHLTTPKGQ